MAATFLMGPMELLFLMFLGGGGMGIPLGMPPLPEDPVLAQVAPEECLFYTSWAGTAEPDARSANQTEQLLAEPEVQHLISEIERLITNGIREAAREEGGPEAQAIASDAIRGVKMLLTRPTAMFVSKVEISPRGPDIRAGAVVNVGEDAAEFKSKLEKYQQAFLRGAAQPVQVGNDTWYRITLDPAAPQITWGMKNGYFILGVGEGSVEGMAERVGSDPPEWLANIKRQIPVDRRATVSYIDVKAIARAVAPLLGARGDWIVSGIADALGLGNVTSVVAVTGLDETGFVSKMLVALDGEPEGLLTFAAAEPLAPEDLAPIPADSTVAFACRLDVNQVLETVLEAEGGLVITGLTAVVEVDDRERLAATQAMLLGMARGAMAREASFRGGRRRGPTIDQFRFAGHDVYVFNARDDDFPVAPSWCLTDDALVVAPFPQNIKAYLSHGDDHEPITAVPEVAGLFESGSGPVMLSYVDTQEIFELVYPFVPMFAQAMLGELAREGIDVSVSILPSARSISPHLLPGVGTVRLTEAGVEITRRQSLPGGNVGATLPLAAGLMIPAVTSARGAAYRAQSMNNMKQIALALHSYHDTHKSFPPAFTTDEDGKPLLSWRVLILPYIEQVGLYRQFHLDEPWDSDHNKRFISMMPASLRAPDGHAPPGRTHYLGVAGEHGIFSGEKGTRIAQITDGTSNTVMVVEANDQSAVIWTKPGDFVPNAENPIDGLVGLRPGGFNAGCADGSVHFISQFVDGDMLKRLFMRDDGQPVDTGDLGGSRRGSSRVMRTFPARQVEVEMVVEEAEAEAVQVPDR
ncbi:MAG: DUF1559 domain-containing protein [Planctomycetota bacterium]|jgi:hypothetical protein